MLPLPRASTAVTALALLVVLSPGALALEQALGAMRVAHSDFYGTQNLNSYSALQLENGEGLQGRDINIAVISTGIDNEHPTFKGAYRTGRDFVTRTEPATVECRDPDDVDGAGTYYASLVLGRGGAGLVPAPAASAGLVDVRVAASVAGITREGVAEAIDWIIDLDAGRVQNCLDVLRDPIRVIVVPHTLGHAAIGSDPTRAAISRATEAGMLVVVPAGDAGPPVAEQDHAIESPGAAEDALTVGAVDHRGTANRNQDHLLPSSSRGSFELAKPDIAAPGANVTAALFAVPSQPWGTRTASGTAVAASLVAGVAAQVFEAYAERNLTATPETVKEVLMATAQDQGPPDWDPNWGAGYVDAYALGLELLNRPPRLSVVVYPSDPVVGERVLVDASGSFDPDRDTDDEITMFTFHWGDGSGSEQGQQVVREHRFGRSGSFPLRVVAEDRWGATAEHTIEINVSAPPAPEPGRPPVPRISVTPLQPVAGQVVVLDASGSTDPEDDIDRYEWDLDHPPGSSFDVDATGPNVEHVFETNGTAHVALRVWDRAGHRADDVREITIFPRPPGPPPPPTVRLTHPLDGDTLASGERDVFWIVLRGEPQRYFLSLDGRDVGVLSVVHGTVNLEPGDHVVSVRAVDDLGRTGTDSVRFTVVEAPDIGPGADVPDGTTTPPDDDGNGSDDGSNGTPGPQLGVVVLALCAVAALVSRRRRPD